MTQAIVDPEDLVLFAQDLRNFNSDLYSRLVTIKSKFDQLGYSWQDQEQAKFALEFEQTVQVLVRFMEVVEEQIPFLLRKAEAARNYLDQK